MNRYNRGQKPKIVSLDSALIKTSKLRASVRANLDAIKNTDRQLILESERRKIVDAVDLDAATQQQYPTSHRWDYVVCASNALVGIEPHPAKDDQLRNIVAKKSHAQLVLTAELINGARVSRWIWVTRGRVTFSQNEKAQRYLAQNGIEFQGRVVRSL